MLEGLRRWLRSKACHDCDATCDRLRRAEELHVMSVDAVKTARRKQARRLSDVRIVVDATLRQIERRAEGQAEENRE